MSQIDSDALCYGKDRCRPGNNQYKQPTLELEYILKQSDAKVMVIIDEYRDIDYVRLL